MKAIDAFFLAVEESGFDIGPDEPDQGEIAAAEGERCEGVVAEGVFGEGTSAEGVSDENFEDGGADNSAADEIATVEGAADADAPAAECRKRTNMPFRQLSGKYMKRGGKNKDWYNTKYGRGGWHWQTDKGWHDLKNLEPSAPKQTHRLGKQPSHQAMFG